MGVCRFLQEPHTPAGPTLLLSLSPNSTLIFFPGSILHFPSCLVSGQWIGTFATGLRDRQHISRAGLRSLLLRLLSPMAQAGHPGLFWSPEAFEQPDRLVVFEAGTGVKVKSSCPVEQDVPSYMTLSRHK